MNAEPVRTARLTLEPLAVHHATEMAEVLGDPALHTFIGGSPETPERLRDRYARLAAPPPPDRGESWLNWVIRLHAPDIGSDRLDDDPGSGSKGGSDSGSDPRAGGSDRLVGYVQATVAGDRATVAWVVGTPWQGRGIAGEAAVALVAWLRERGTTTIVATIHPDHTASSAVARRAGLTPTDGRVDGEVVWRSGQVRDRPPTTDRGSHEPWTVNGMDRVPRGPHGPWTRGRRGSHGPWTP
ncbi:GNAT family N-acetyltransferase [Streptosporangium vulgare]|uniref:GNAT family N-acetyltransferase n=1 Tax=Streptosporangium vulgare TaxID=46190 RepID=A0ABV5T6F0_9ACTN